MSTKVCQTSGESSKFTLLKTCRARPVSQAGIAKIDQLAEKLRQRDSDASSRKYFGKFPTTSVRWLQGVKFYCYSCKIKDPVQFPGTPI